jgi:hypothetical protein
LEDSAHPLLVVESRVYGDGWHVIGSASTREQEIDHAEAMYEFVEDGDKVRDDKEFNGENDAAVHVVEVSDDDDDDDDDASWTSDSTENQDDDY